MWGNNLGVALSWPPPGAAWGRSPSSKFVEVQVRAG